MSEGNTGAEFLQQKYQLNKDLAVVATAKRHEQRSKAIDQGDFTTRITNYLNRLNSIINPPTLVVDPSRRHADFDRKERNLSMIKRGLYQSFVTKPEDISESYYDSIKRRHREEGHGDIEILEDYRQELAQTIIEDQKKSLDLWIDYLAPDDAKYPEWVKYFVFRSVLGMGNYDKKRGIFNERTRGGRTMVPFPELNREALAIVTGDLEKKYSIGKDKPAGRADFEFTSRYDIPDDTKQKYLKALENKNFSQLYGLAIEEYKPIAEELLKTTEGEWVKFPRGADPKSLVSSISNHGTGWCLRGEAMAQRYLVRDQNDLYVYYSKNQEGKSVVPRVVMVVNQNGNITEVRGVGRQEELDPYIGDVVEAKLGEPEFEKEGRAYKKKASDMKTLTAIERKVNSKQELSAEDLIFLYEINSQIEGFGYDPKDPRVAQLKSKRNPEEDMPIVFGCEKDQIARSIKEIKADTKAYVGPLEPGIFDLVAKFNIEHIFTSFPEGRIRIETLEIGGIDFKKLFKELEEKFQIKNELTWNKAREVLEKIRAGSVQVDADTIELLSQLVEKQINISGYALDMLKSSDFTTLKEKQQITLVRARVEDLGFKNGATTAEIMGTEKDTDEHGNPTPFTRGGMTQLGLNFCLPEVGIYQRLKDTNQLLGEWYWIAMKQITDRGGDPHVFRLERFGGGLWLHDVSWASPDSRWRPGEALVFRLRKPEPQTLKHSGFFDKLFRR